MPDLKRQSWYQFLDEGMRDLVNLSYSLLDALSLQPLALGLKNIHDYYFVVFSMAKCYDGFLKNGFLPVALLQSISTKATISALAKP